MKVLSLFDIVTCSSVGVITTCPFVLDDLFCPYNAYIPYENDRPLTGNVQEDLLFRQLVRPLLTL